MYRFFVLLLVALVVVGAAAYVVGRVDGGEPEPGDRPGDGLPGGRLEPDDLRRARFGVGLRGYRMTEVDAVLQRLAGELAARDAELAAARAAPDEGTLAPAAQPGTEPAAGSPGAAAAWRATAVTTANGSRSAESPPAEPPAAPAAPDPRSAAALRERVAVEAALEAARQAARRAAAAAFPRADPATHPDAAHDTDTPDAPRA
ncbi:MAG TPA: DivIVA domain-containing protein [Frankiaceae bacterium]|jgi:DivIVA domain-containing protein